MVDVVRVEGLQELRRALFTVVPLHMQGDTLQKALAAGARPIVEVARLNAPVKSGVLRRAIFAFRDKASTVTYQIRNIGVRSGKRFQKSKRDAFYWRWIEFGRGEVQASKSTGSLGTPKVGFFGKVVRAVPPKPFLRPAFDSQKEVALTRIVNELKKQIDVAAAKARWRTSADSGAGTGRELVGQASDLAGFFDRLP